MIASLEWLCDCVAVLRLHEDGGTLGAPYVWCCTVQRDGATAHLKGAVAAPALEGVRAIRAALNAAGMTQAIWERKGHDGASRTVRVQ